MFLHLRGEYAQYCYNLGGIVGHDERIRIPPYRVFVRQPFYIKIVEVPPVPDKVIEKLPHGRKDSLLFTSLYRANSIPPSLVWEALLSMLLARGCLARLIRDVIWCPVLVILILELTSLTGVTIPCLVWSTTKAMVFLMILRGMHAFLLLRRVDGPIPTLLTGCHF